MNLKGLEGNSSIATSPSVWAGVVIIPSSKAYEPSLDQQNEDKDDEMNQLDENQDQDQMFLSDESAKMDNFQQVANPVY